MTDDTLRDVSAEPLTAAVEANLSAYLPYFRHLPDAELQLGPGLSWALTSVPYALCNSIMGARLKPHEADAAIAAATARGRSRAVPLLWWVGPSSRPADLGRRLQAHGFVPAGSAPGMAADLEALDELLTTPTDFRVTRVRDAEALAVWCDLSQICFELPDQVTDAWRRLYGGVGVSEASALTHYLGWLDGRPVALGSLFLGAGVAGIYNVGTVPEARRRGIGSALTLTALQEARAGGYRAGVLQSSEMGAGVYARLGFREYCRLEHYLWSPPEADAGG